LYHQKHKRRGKKALFWERSEEIVAENSPNLGKDIPFQIPIFVSDHKYDHSDHCCPINNAIFSIKIQDFFFSFEEFKYDMSVWEFLWVYSV